MTKPVVEEHSSGKILKPHRHDVPQPECQCTNCPLDPAQWRTTRGSFSALTHFLLTDLNPSLGQTELN